MGLLKQRLQGAFPSWMRERGKGYFERGMVQRLEPSEDGLLASVLGSELYSVELRWHAGDDDVWILCSCPAFERFEACKHVWAVVLEADARGLGPGRSARRPSRPARGEGSPGWRARVGRAIQRPAAPQPWKELEGDESALSYLLDVEASLVAGVPVVQTFVTPRLKTGKWGAGQPYGPWPWEIEALEDAHDRRVLTLLAQVDRRDNGQTLEERSRYRLRGELGLELLPRMAEHGQLAWSGRAGSGVLRPDVERPWRLALELVEEGRGKAREAVVRGWLERDAHSADGQGEGHGEPGTERIELDEPLLLFESGLVVTRTAIGRVEQRGLAWALELRRGGALRAPVSDAPELVRLLSERGGDAVRRLSGAEVERGEPRPHLYVGARKSGNGARLPCEVSFAYGERRVRAGDPAQVVAATPADGGSGGGRWLRRDPERELRSLARLLELGARRTQRDRALDHDASIAPSRVAGLVRALLAEGWSVEAEGKLWRSAGGTSVSVRSGIDWFEVAGEVSFGELSVPFPELLAAARERRDTVVLGDGSFGVLPERWLERWGLLELAGKARKDALRIPRSQAWLLDALLAARESDDAAEIELDAGFHELRERLARFDGVRPEHEPAGFHGELRAYQRVGLGWLRFLRELRLGGCLADDMGLGKTVQVLAHLFAVRGEREGERLPSLVVAPRSLVFNWLDEAARFTPGLAVLDLTGPDRKRRLERAGPVDLFVTTYGTLQRDAAELRELRFDTVVLDEAQAIKNATSLTAKAARLLRAEHRLALTGTPVENHLGELWSIFEFLNPGMLGRARAFRTWVGATSAAGEDLRAGAGQLGDLARSLRPFFLRRTKEEVLSDLPEKGEQVLVCRLGRSERKRYDELREHYRAALLGKSDQELERGQMHVLEALLRLRQCACHPGLLDHARRGEGSAKLDTLLAHLTEIAAEGHKALVFSQFTTLLGILRERLDALPVAYAYLDGRTRKRKEAVERFQSDPACPLFLVSLKAGGHGLNLTAADFVYLLDPWWNPAVESQAIDRAHRIGRTRPVLAYRLIAADTVEERIQELQADKRALAEALFAPGHATSAAITREELERLLG